MNDLIGLAIERAVAQFGDRGDGLFNAAGFSSAFVKLAGTTSPIDGMVVRAMLCGRPDVRVVGDAHYQRVTPGRGQP